MYPNLYFHDDVLRGVVSPDPVVDCSVEPDLARQEFKDECDLNVLLNRFIRTGQLPPARAAVFGDIDFDMDRQSALAARQAVYESWDRLSPELKERYATPEAYLTAAAQLKLDLSDPDPRRRAEDSPRGRRASDKTAAESAALHAAISDAVAKRSAAGA